MRLLSRAALACCALAAGSLAGCASPTDDAPILDYVESPVAVTAEHGAYTIPVSVGFHDKQSDVVTRVHYRLPPSIDAVVDIKTPIPTCETADVVLVIPAPMPGSSDIHQLEIAVINGLGAESLPLSREVSFH